MNAFGRFSGAKADFAAFIGVVVRIEASVIMGLAIGAAYQLTQPVESRKGATFTYGVICMLAAIADMSHAGWIPYGSNPLNRYMSEKIAAETVPFIALWGVLGCLFWGAFFTESKSKLS